MSELYLVLLETSGNQNYIFSTNKLKENIGASELTYRAGTQWIIDAVRGEKVQQSLREVLLNPELNPPIEQEGNTVEIILATSGKALLLTRTAEQAQAIIRQVTQQALEEAPGLEICGVFVSLNWETDCLGEMNRQVHQRYEQVRSEKPSADLRFLRLPIFADCASSEFPANHVDTVHEETVLLSVLAHAKRQASAAGVQRLAQVARRADMRLAQNVDQLEKRFEEELDWLAVVHADGNGLGEIFLKFHEHIAATTAQDNRRYINTLRLFSLALDVCTETAFNMALKTFQQKNENTADAPQDLPVVPLILGGDDLTVICDGQSALPFVRAFLLAFEAETQKEQNLGRVKTNVIPEIAKKALKVGRLSACAGVAIVKPHFPFSVAYALAADLIQSAKGVKLRVTQSGSSGQQPYPCSALDFHILYDSSDVDLDLIRGHLHIKLGEDPPVWLYNRPYVVTALGDLSGVDGHDWAEFHHWQKLQEGIDLLLETDDEGRRCLPNSQTHDLRAALFLGKAAADARYQLIRQRYESLERLAGSPDSLFQAEPGTHTDMTALMDIIDAAEFIGKTPHAEKA
ncbi:hypothetical protein GS597_16165 [Synechococcales cyanobacterium C]|uniref:Cas10/Cmr2 second palm domain-containing protein n=1 Tax=Petrachloros mirabilis ULC683 TaxID=2781853 RepID=A0A8K2A043_9CYAN|nr:hypothetical protein [Petrachloros mirabilis]NCJ08013.1 hypothetical protein [Petrachloros mirabilis ULC683]